MKLGPLLVLVFGGVGAVAAYSEEQVNGFMADMWLEGVDVMRILWRDCSKKLIESRDATEAKEYFPKFVKCMKRKTLKALDRSLSTDVVPLADGVNLVRYELVDRTGNVMQSAENDTNDTWSEQELESGSWRALALERMAQVLRTHVIKLDFGGEDSSTEKVEFRHRRRHQMMTMMMFGIISMGMVLVPMGFQFLAVLGGKALLLAKMALILSSIQGLKKVEEWNKNERRKVGPSPVNYGYYHSYPTPYDHYDKRAYNDWPEPDTLPTKVPPLSSLDRSENSAKTDRGFVEARTWRPEIPKQVIWKTNNEVDKTNPRLYPVYPAQSETSSESAASTFFGTIDSPSTVLNPTAIPEVHAEYSVDLPINRIHFQSPTTVISA